jgi:membrane protease YdiL (CAAX protease family)
MMGGAVSPTSLWLLTVLAGLAVWTANDMRQYREFKAASDGVARQRFYLLWTAQSFVILVGGAAITAAVLDRGVPLLVLPAEFQELAAALQPPDLDAVGEDSRLGMMIGLILGAGAAIGVQVWRMRRALSAIVGDVDAIIPRSRREMLAALPLCLNAGFSEELFFRLALPLLIASVTGSVIIGMAASVVIFGLIHAYQGWKGVVATTLIGVVLTMVYLRSGSILTPMIMHALIDVVALIVRPVVAARFSRSKGRRDVRDV